MGLAPLTLFTTTLLIARLVFFVTSSSVASASVASISAPLPLNTQLSDQGAGNTVVGTVPAAADADDIVGSQLCG
jgi:hypothetical protein